MNLQSIAEKLDSAAQFAQPIEQISFSNPITLDDAYAVQALSMQLRYDRKDTLIGLKMGFTSEAKMQQMGVHDMIWGRLTSKMLLPMDGVLLKSQFIHPRAEPEICFRVSKSIDRELTMEEAPDYVDGIAAAIEIIDSRYQNFKFSLEDVVADNCSSAALVVGNWHQNFPALDNLQMVLKINGEKVESGSSADILGNPWKAFVAATRLAAKQQQTIPAGFLIMAGAATPAAFISAGQQVQAEVETLGQVSFKVQ